MFSDRNLKKKNIYKNVAIVKLDFTQLDFIYYLLTIESEQLFSHLVFFRGAELRLEYIIKLDVKLVLWLDLAEINWTDFSSVRTKRNRFFYCRVDAVFQEFH